MAESSKKSYSRISVGYGQTYLRNNDVMNICIEELRPSMNEVGVEFIMNTGTTKLNTLSVEYTRGYKIKESNFLFEFGAKAGFGFGTNTTKNADYIYKHDTQLLTFTVPVNLGYQIKLSKNVGLTPYAGLNLKVHAMGRSKYANSFSYTHVSVESKFQYYDWSSLYDNHSNFAHVQAGWQAGLSLSVRNFYVGGCYYGTDFYDFYNEKINNTLTAKIKSSSFTLSAGMYF